jgi:hypothetical protein
LYHADFNSPKKAPMPFARENKVTLEQISAIHSNLAIDIVFMFETSLIYVILQDSVLK